MAKTRLAMMAGLLLSLGACSQKAALPTVAIQTISDFTLSETQRKIVQWTLRAEQAVLKDEGNAELTNPHVEVFENGKLTTQLQSKQGIYFEATRNIHMQDDVVVVSQDQEDAKPTTLKTDALDFINSEQKFKTDHRVVVTRKGSIMHGKGMIANRDLSEIQILHQESKIE